MRKEKETSRASCIHYGGLTAIAVRVADTRGTRAGFDVLLRREEGENGVKIGPWRQIRICIERLKFCVLAASP